MTRIPLCRHMSSWPLLFGLLLSLLLVVHPAPASEPGESPGARLAEILEDDEARARLIEELRGLDTAREEAPEADVPAPISLARQVAELTQGFAQSAVAEFRGAGQAFAGIADEGLGPALSQLGEGLLALLLLIVATVAAFLLMRRLARPLFDRISAWAAKQEAEQYQRKAGSRFVSLVGMLWRAVAIVVAAAIDLLVILVAWVAGYSLSLFVFGDAGVMDTRHSLFLNAFLLVEVFKALLRVVFAARNDALRLLPIAAEDAAYWNAWLARLAGFIGYGMLVVVPIVNIAVSPGIGRAVGLLVMFAAFINALVIILQNRKQVHDRVQAQARRAKLGFTKVLLSTLAELWHLLAIAYFAALAIVTITHPEDALPFMAQATLQTLLVVGVGVLISVVLTQLISRGVRVPAKTRERFPLLESRLNAFVPSSLKVVRAAIVLVVLAMVLDAWAVFNFTAWLASDTGGAVVLKAVTVAIILAASVLLWIAVASWIEHRLNPQTGVGEPGARERTLLTIFRNAIAVALVTITLMIVLAEIGINIGPLIAGAGVLGLAIGFGAQKLVQDIITGVFIQLENAINTGDVVTAAGITGTAETLTIRSVGIRDLSGTFHIVPFSSVDSVSNFNREYAYHVGVYGVAYREDIDETISHLRAAFAELLEDPEHGPNILEPELEVHGVTALADSSINIRVRIKTVGGAQWAVGRAYNRLVKRHLDAAGIEIPFPHLTLYFGEDKEGRAPPVNANVKLLGGLAAASGVPAAAAQGSARPQGEGPDRPEVDPREARTNPKQWEDYDEEGD
ncbi:mechanosensitive ion channel domain-containing protein [Alkalilimnicola ehrlichii]|uniref:mechanosensitive ion channel domain-containing protein n=1 Tax=Alkalilimnicola ehrlichii TaxID=351052 RepID=UPI003BA27908